MSVANALYSSDRQDHNTPLEVLERVRRVDSIGLDPCSNAQSIVGARVEWRLERGEDGLTRSWQGFGLVYVNNPYDEGLAWATKVTTAACYGVEIIGLVPARTDTEWFQDHIARAAALCFWRGRLKFGAGIPDRRQLGMGFIAPAPLKEPENCAPFPSLVWYFGNRPERFCDAFDGAGYIPPLKRERP